MFSSFGAFFGRLFGTEKALNAVVDGVSNGLDKLWYTDEEKADAAAQDRSEARKMVVAWMASTQGQNLARRLIALSITGVWLSQYVMSQVMNVVSIWTHDPDRWLKSAKVLKDGAIDMNGAVMLILAFYFAAPHMADFSKAIIGNFTRKVSDG